MKPIKSWRNISLPKISVVIPTFNRCESLKKAVQSVLEQTFCDYEIVIVNDGSTDQTAAYLDSLIRKYPQISIVSFNENRGGNYARNEGIRKSSGELIAFLDDDDYFVPDKLEKAVSILRQTNIDLLYSAKNIYSPSRKYVRYSYKKPRFNNPLKSIMIDNFIGSTSAVIVKKSRLDAVGGFDPCLPALQDYDLYIRLISAGSVIKGTDTPLITYTMNPEKSKVSCCYAGFKKAANFFVKKYKGQPYFSLLKISLLTIGFKKALKSKNGIKDMIQFFHVMGTTLLS